MNKSKIVKDALKFALKGQFDKAIAEYDKILKETPNDATTHNAVGDLYLKRNDTDAAIESFKRAAEILNKDGFTLKAIALYKKVLNLKADQVDVLMLMGKLNAERKMLGSANEYYLAAAAYFSKQGNKAKAIDVYKILCDLNPDNLALAEKLADLYTSEGMEKEAVSKYIDLAESKIAKGEYREARDFLDKAAPKGSHRLDFIKNAAILDLKENRLREAIIKFQDARNIDANDAQVSGLLADSLLRAGRYEEAEELLQGLIAASPANPDYRSQLIDVHIKSGDYTAAWKETSSLYDSLFDKNEFDKAEVLLKNFISQKPDSVEARRLLADVYKKLGQDSEVDRVNREMADVYFESGAADKALNIYRQLLENSPDDTVLKERIASISSGGTGLTAPQPPEPEAPSEESSWPASTEISGTTKAYTPEAPAFELPEQEGFGIGEAPVFDMETGGDTFGFQEAGGADESDEPLPEDLAGGPSIFELDEAASPFDLADEHAEPVAEETVAGFDLAGTVGQFDISGGTDEEQAGAVFELPETEEPFAPSYEIPEAPEGPSAPAYELPEASPEEPPAPTYDITETGGEFPAFDLGEEAGGFTDLGMTPQEGAAELGAAEEIGGLDIFGAETDVESEPGLYEVPHEETDLHDQQVKLVIRQSSPDLADVEALARQAEETEAAFPPSFEDRLAEVEVYIKYGLSHKAMDSLYELVKEYPSDTGLRYRLIEVYKAEGDVDGYMRTSIDLADMLMEKRLLDDARQVVTKALSISPGNSQLKIRLECLNELSGPRKPVQAATPAETASAVEEPVSRDPMATMKEAVADRYAEEISEAAFYIQQGLIDEARKIYFGILAEDPGNEAALDRLRSLPSGPAESEFFGLETREAGEETIGYTEQAAELPEFEPATEMPPAYSGPADESSFEELDIDNIRGEVRETPVEAARPEPVKADQFSALDDELDAAFREMDMGFGEEERPEPAPPAPPPAPEPPAVMDEEAVTADEVGFFDLAAELRDELDDGVSDFQALTSESFEDKNLEAVFNEFKKGVEEQLGTEDYETHYNLGIAYKEMGMLDEALNEFTLASKDAARTLDCASMLGLCYMEKGEFQKAIDLFNKGLSVRGRAKEEYMGLRYDMATAYELSGDEANARSILEGLLKEDPGFRDVADRLRELGAGASDIEDISVPDDEAVQELEPEPAPEQPKQQEKTTPTPKKSRVSYL
ncbi:MAG: tetratricopeptide repeat protein [Nitrospirae bacterium]|nr:tetratricopeptide repeat protein [Nitrospirota bacterium]